MKKLAVLRKKRSKAGKVRRPKDLKKIDAIAYTGFAGDGLVYIGGTGSSEHQQLYGLTAKDCLKLAAWLTKAAAYLKQQQRQINPRKGVRE